LKGSLRRAFLLGTVRKLHGAGYLLSKPTVWKKCKHVEVDSGFPARPSNQLASSTNKYPSFATIRNSASIFRESATDDRAILPILHKP
jgi:hypothetical protein